mgnify:FL=1
MKWTSAKFGQLISSSNFDQTKHPPMQNFHQFLQDFLGAELSRVMLKITCFQYFIHWRNFARHKQSNICLLKLEINSLVFSQKISKQPAVCFATMAIKRSFSNNCWIKALHVKTCNSLSKLSCTVAKQVGEKIKVLLHFATQLHFIFPGVSLSVKINENELCVCAVKESVLKIAGMLLEGIHSKRQ